MSIKLLQLLIISFVSSLICILYIKYRKIDEMHCNYLIITKLDLKLFRWLAYISGIEIPILAAFYVYIYGDIVNNTLIPMTYGVYGALMFIFLPDLSCFLLKIKRESVNIKGTKVLIKLALFIGCSGIVILLIRGIVDGYLFFSK